MSTTTVPTGDVAHIPDELKALPCWVVWKWETRREPDGEEKHTKVPYNARDGKGASTTKPSTWASFKVAHKALGSGEYTGLGFVFSPKANGFVGIDLDKCRDPVTGEIAAWAWAIIIDVASYCEISPPGAGVHIIAAGALPPGRRKGPYQGGAVEMYDAGRFFTVTGAHLDGTSATVEPCGEAIAALHARLWPTPPPRPKGKAAPLGSLSLTDGELIAKALAAKNGAKFTRLWNGDWSGYPSQSEADAALVWCFAFWLRDDADGVDRLMRQSGLQRENWDRPDGQYGTHLRRTIANGLGSYRGAYYTPPVAWDTREQGDQRNDSGEEEDKATGERADEHPECPARVGNYQTTAQGLVWWKRAGEGAEEPVTLTNFPARIVAEVLRDDGLEATLAFDIEAELRGRVYRFAVPAERFASMNWVPENLGAGAIVSAGFGSKDHARAAILTLSPAAPRRHVHLHTGWVRPADGSAPYFTHAGGAICPKGNVAEVAVEVGHGLHAFCLPEPPAFGSEAERAAVRASVALWDVAPLRVTVPLHTATFRAPLGSADFAAHLTGQTGLFKSELAALLQQHYGVAMDRPHLPASWKSTANALEAQAFHAKDVLLVVDDFCPTGSAVDVARLHAAADNLFRGAGNGAGRARLRSDTSARPPKPPRALILSTGEETPRGHSLRARLCIVEIQPNDVNKQQLTECQRDAATGVYALAMAGYIRWLAETYAEWQPAQHDELVTLREQAAAQGGSAHHRTPEVTANLALGLRRFLAYAQACGALTAEEAGDRYQRGWKALCEVAASQAQAQAESEPTRRFLELVNTVLASGEAHLATLKGEKPGTDGESWGWRKETHYSGGFATEEWEESGRRIGWLDGEQLYLEPDAAYTVVQRAAVGDPLGISVQTLGKRLKERGLLASIDTARETSKVRKTCEGRQQNVWHITARTLSTYNPPDKPDKAGEGQTGSQAQQGQMSGLEPDNEQNPTSYPTSPDAVEFGAGEVSVGFVGSIQSTEGAAVNEAHSGLNGNRPLSGSSQKPDNKTRHLPSETRQPDNPTFCRACGGQVVRWFGDELHCDQCDELLAERAATG